MAIRSSQFFTFNSIKSTDFGIWNVNISSGMLEEPFMASRSINEVKIRGRDKPYFSGITNSPLTFTLSFAFPDAWDSDKIRAVSRWLFTDYYKPLQFSDNLDRVYYVVFDGDSTLVHNGASQGYINLSCRADSPYSYSPVYTSPTYDLSSNPVGGTIISINNMGDLPTNPEIYIDKVGLGSVEIVNLSNSGISTKFDYAITDPTVAPVLSQVTAATPLTPATYYCKYSWSGTSGETKVSPETSIVLTSGNVPVVTIPSLPTNATQTNIYISTASGTETKQGTTVTTTYTQSVALVSGASMPSVNSSGIRDGENLYVDCETEYISSDQIGIYRYSNFSNNFLELLYGSNSLQINGNCKIKFRYSFIYLQG